jgi:hypothetical protein
MGRLARFERFAFSVAVEDRLHKCNHCVNRIVALVLLKIAKKIPAGVRRGEKIPPERGEERGKDGAL